MINRSVLTGRLTNDVELKYTTSGIAVATFTLAVNRRFKNSNGEQEADFIRCVIWKKGAEMLSQYTSKGAQLAVDGRIQTRNFENEQGQRVYLTEVVVDQFSLLDSKAENDARRQSAQNGTGANQQQSGTNTQQWQNNSAGGQSGTGNNPFDNPPRNDPFGGGQEVDIKDDDLPF